jgi:hypothetical protein
VVIVEMAGLTPVTLNVGRNSKRPEDMLKSAPLYDSSIVAFPGTPEEEQ